MYSTITLATWKDNAVSMSHTVMEGATDKTDIMETHLNMLDRLDKVAEKDENNTDTTEWQRLDGMWVASVQAGIFIHMFWADPVQRPSMFYAFR